MNPLIQLKKICLVCVAVLACYGLSPALNATTITVTNTNDSGPGSLRAALAVANDGDTIDATGVSGTILLTGGELQITHSVSITGPGAGNLAVNGNATFTVFENFAAHVTISGFTITNGHAAGEPFNSGGIYNQGGLTLSNSSVVNNAGGGIGNNANGRLATLTITNCTVSGNSGSGIFNVSIATGLAEGATLTVSNCTISGNSASNGGGIYNAAFSGVLDIIPINARSTVAISNSTLSGNSAIGDGGAIYNNGAGHFGPASVSVKNSTISDNSATGHGGGIYNNELSGPAYVELGGTILKAGSSGENIFNHFGGVTSLGYNLASDNGGGFLTGFGDQFNTNPMLGPLQHNGGPTFTHALLPGSPAINGGNPNFTPPPMFDQRGPGFPRVVNGRIDIGSFEAHVLPTPTPTPTPIIDFNGDGHPDYVLHNISTRQTAIWYLKNNVWIGSAYGPTLPPGWGVKSVADFNRDGYPDYALFNPVTDQTGIWYLFGPTLIASAYGPTLPGGLELVATADFNRDGKPDYVLYTPSTGQTTIWYLDNHAFVGAANGPTLPAGWNLMGVADFNGDGKPDYVLYNATTSETAIWYLDNHVFVGARNGPTLPAGWELVATADFNGDGKPDYLLYNPSTRQTAIWYLNNNVFVGGAYGPTLPAGWFLVGP